MVNSVDPETKIASIPPFGLRMQSGLKRRLEEAAKANGRSLNSEIVARLEQSLASPDLEKRLALLEDIWANLMFDERLETIGNRLSALEHRLGEQSN
jgi:Arc-like DNA binding domain